MSLIPLEAVGAVLQVLGSASAKFAFGDDSVPADFATSTCAHLSAGSEHSALATKGCGLATRGIFLVGLLLFNSFGLMLYLKGMARSGALVATVVNTATSTIMTAVIGKLLFGEALSLKWGMGAAMICAGVALLSDAKARADKEAAAAVAEPSPVAAQAAVVEAKAAAAPAAPAQDAPVSRSSSAGSEADETRRAARSRSRSESRADGKPRRRKAAAE